MAVNFFTGQINVIESITPSKYRLLFALAIPVERGGWGPQLGGNRGPARRPRWGAPVTDDQESLLEGGPPRERPLRCRPLPGGEQ